MSQYDYDLFVIGAGSGGVRAARVAASHGAKVAIAEEYRYGGTCVIRGCIPKKLFVYASEFRSEFDLAKDFGWNPGPASFDWKTLVANKDKEIDRLNKIYVRILDNFAVTMFDGHACLADPHTVEVNGQRISCRYVLIATGGSPYVLDVPGAEHAITSNEAFHLEALPEDIVIIGGGYIAVEFAGIFNGLGSKVSLVHRGSHLLRGFDDEVGEVVTADLAGRGINLSMSNEVRSITVKSAGQLQLAMSDGSILLTQAVMFATGRSPNTAGLGLEHAGVALGDRGQVLVDAYSKSSADHIYAVGDVTDRVNLTPVAIREGQAFADTVFGGRPSVVDHSLIPTAVFSQPPVGTVGLSEQDARQRHGKIDVYKSEFRPLRKTLGASTEKVFMKLLVERDTDKVLGLHMVGKDAPEIVQMAAIAMRLGATKNDFDNTIALHPTTAEEFVLMRTKHEPPMPSS